MYAAGHDTTPFKVQLYMRERGAKFEERVGVHVGNYKPSLLCSAQSHCAEWQATLTAYFVDYDFICGMIGVSDIS
jgi:hypothetical protein